MAGSVGGVERPFPPSPRRRAVARAAGVVLASPAWTAAFAVAAGVVAIGASVAASAGGIAGRARGTFAAAADGDPVARATTVDASRWIGDVLAAVAPVVVACLAGALAAAAVLARGLVVPRRSVRGAPAVPDAPGIDGALGLARGAAAAAVAASFVWSQLPVLGELATAAAEGAGLADSVRILALAALAHLAVAAVLLGALDALVRHGRLAAALRMTPREARDEARDAGTDPARRRRIRDARVADPRDHLAEAAALLVGFDAVVALRWHPGLPAPEVLVAARGLRGRQLVAAARHRAVPALADDALAESLAGVRGAVPAAHHAALARILAARGD